MNPTPEQLSGIAMTLALKPGQIGVGNAYAGTGKTTTATLIAGEATRKGWRVLYCCFNAAMAEEARGRFPCNVTCKTAHSLAYAETGRGYAATKLVDGTPKLGNLRLADVRRATGAQGSQASDILDGINSFLASQDDTPGLHHLSEAARNTETLTHLGGIWRKMVDYKGDAPMTHDGYLKLWIADNPSLPYDLIIVDEAQDLNPSLLRFIEAQARANKRILLIGDTHQSIYGFRKATNAMQWAGSLASGNFTLTESWRFGSKTAAAASALLSDYKQDRVTIVGRGPKKGDKPTNCILARTNGSLLFRALTEVRRGCKVHFAATGQRDNWSPRTPYRFAEFEDAAGLYLRKPPHLMRTPLIRQFASWMELCEAAEEDAELGSIVRFVEDVGAATIPTILARLEAASTAPATATIHFSSAHRAKGKEWTTVELMDDFLPLDNSQKMADLLEDKGPAVMAEEINLLYVAITRGCEGFTPHSTAYEYFRKCCTRPPAAPRSSPPSLRPTASNPVRC